MNILIVDDSRTARFYARTAAERCGHTVIAAIECAENAALYCVGGGVDMILMDVCTADDVNGISAAAKIKRDWPHIRVIIMTSMPEYSFLQKARQAGCDGFWYKDHGQTELEDVITRVFAGERVYPVQTPVLTVGAAQTSEFSVREMEIVRLLAEGCSRSEIAAELAVSPRTVGFHIEAMKDKTGYTDTMKLVADIVEKKIIINSLRDV